jgi:hypothetical protein
MLHRWQEIVVYKYQNRHFQYQQNIFNTNKKGTRRCLFIYAVKESGSGNSQTLDLGRQPALGAGCLILVNNLLVGDAVKDSNGLLEDILSSSFVASVDSLTHTLDRGTQGRTQAGVMGALLVSLTGALAGLCAIGHVYYPEVVKSER